MGSFKNFLFPKKEENEFDTTTVIVKKDDIRMSNEETSIVKPLIFSEVEDIANGLLKGKSIIVDLTDTKIEEAKRICDFLNGVIFCLNGSVKKISKLVYLFNPKG